MQVLVRDNNVDQALKALKKKMQREGIFREMKLRGHYEKPSEKKAREKAEAVRRARKLARKKLQREGLLPMKPKPVFGAGPGGDRGGAAAAVVARVPVRADRADIFRRFEFRKRGPLRPAFLFFDRCIFRRSRATYAAWTREHSATWPFRLPCSELASRRRRRRRSRCSGSRWRLLVRSGIVGSAPEKRKPSPKADRQYQRPPASTIRRATPPRPGARQVRQDRRGAGRVRRRSRSTPTMCRPSMAAG